MNQPYKNIRVLIIDDDFLSISYLENKLRQLAIKSIYKANDGLEGLELIRKKKKEIDLILLDINMPNMDGIELLRHLAAEKFLGGIIIISCEEDGIISMVKGLSEIHQLNCLGTLQKVNHFKELDSIIQPFIHKQVKLKKSQTKHLKAEEIIQGLAKGEFINFYQPKISMHSGQIMGCETLVRWQHPKLGLITPNDFIPTLIKANLTLELTKLIITQSMQDFANHLSANPNFSLSMNISVQDLNWLDLPVYIAERASYFAIDPKQLIFELTETEFFNNARSALEILAKIRLAGFNLAIDDFGIGFSNLEKLKLIKFDEIKIDRSFVHHAHLNPTAQAILKSCCFLGKSLGMVITAEGVENSEDKDNLLEFDIDQAQGSFYSKALPFDSFIEFYSNFRDDL